MDDIYKLAKDRGLAIFVVEPKAMEHANAWLEKHKLVCKFTEEVRSKAAIGVGPKFTFSSTSIGEMQSVECACGEFELINADDL